METQEVDIYAADMKPETTGPFLRKHFRITPPKEKRSKLAIIVCIDDSGYLEIEHAYGFGDISLNTPGKSQENFQNRQAVHEYLTEWELAKWLPIGPEDSELFATKKLDPEWGVE